MMFLMTISRNYVRVTFLSFICTSSSASSLATISPLNWLAKINKNHQHEHTDGEGKIISGIMRHFSRNEEPWPPSILIVGWLFPWWEAGWTESKWARLVTIKQEVYSASNKMFIPCGVVDITLLTSYAAPYNSGEDCKYLPTFLHPTLRRTSNEPQN